jgi:cytochrome c oxidase cbb3-type subunit 3
MKFINYLESITDVSIYPLASMFIFVIFFVGVLYRVLREDKSSIEEQKNIPFDL